MLRPLLRCSRLVVPLYREVFLFLAFVSYGANSLQLQPKKHMAHESNCPVLPFFSIARIQNYVIIEQLDQLILDPSAHKGSCKLQCDSHPCTTFVTRLSILKVDSTEPPSFLIEIDRTTLIPQAPTVRQLPRLVHIEPAKRGPGADYKYKVGTHGSLYFLKETLASLASLKSEAEREEIAEAESKAKKRRLLGLGLAGGWVTYVGQNVFICVCIQN